MAADDIPAWSDTTQTSTSGACWETCRLLGKGLVWWWPAGSYTVWVRKYNLVSQILKASIGNGAMNISLVMVNDPFYPSITADELLQI